MREYNEGDEYKTKGSKYLLKRFVHTILGRRYSESQKGFLRLEKTYDVWEAEDRHGNTVLVRINQPNPILDDCEETSNIERTSFINDENEVNLLTDSYEEWIDNKRNKNIVDPRLLNVRLEHFAFLEFLKAKSRVFITSSSPTYKKKIYGWKLLYYHRTVPSYIGHKLFDRFCKENPDLWEKMKVDISQWKNEYKQEKKRSTETSIEGLVEE